MQHGILGGADARRRSIPIQVLMFSYVAFFMVQLTGCAGGPGHAGLRLFRQSKGAPWTILCMEMQGAYRADYIEQFTATLKRTPGIRIDDVRVTHDDDGFSRIYYGTYLRHADRKTGRRTLPDRLRADLKLMHELVGAQGERFFGQARMVRKPQPDVGDPAWALERAEGVYTLQVAAFESTDDFWEHKQAAAGFCAWLRSKKYEAYYYHGPACSIVTVGTFNRSAVVETRPGMGYYSDEVRALQKDELLKYNLVNGAVVRTRTLEFSDLANLGVVQRERSEKGGSTSAGVPIPSRLVKIPRAPGKPSQ